MTKPPRIAALIADGFQEEECLVPRFALQLLGARVDMVSSTKAPVEIYSYFERVGTYDVDYVIDAHSTRGYAEDHGIAGANVAVSAHCRRRAIFPCLIVQTWQKGATMCTPVVFTVPE